MKIKLGSIAAEIEIAPGTLSCFMSGSVRTELIARRIGEYTGLPWQRLQEMTPEDLEAVLFQAYLDKHFPWLQNIKKCPCDYENYASAGA
jgi:hypothetical protein